MLHSNKVELIQSKFGTDLFQKILINNVSGSILLWHSLCLILYQFASPRSDNGEFTIVCSILNIEQNCLRQYCRQFNCLSSHNYGFLLPLKKIVLVNPILLISPINLLLSFHYLTRKSASLKYYIEILYIYLRNKIISFGLEVY